MKSKSHTSLENSRQPSRNYEKIVVLPDRLASGCWRLVVVALKSIYIHTYQCNHWLQGKKCAFPAWLLIILSANRLPQLARKYTGASETLKSVS